MKKVLLALIIAAVALPLGGSAMASDSLIAERQAILKKIPGNIRLKKEIQFPNHNVRSQVIWDIVSTNRGTIERLRVYTGNRTTTITTFGLTKQTFAILETTADKSCVPMTIGGEFASDQQPIFTGSYDSKDPCQPSLENLEKELIILTKTSLKAFGIMSNADLAKLIRK